MGRRPAMWLQSGSIYCFHGADDTTDGVSDPIHIPTAQLRTMIEGIQRFSEIVPLRVFVDRVSRGASIGGLAALTFDDCYESLSRLFAEYLVPSRVPATTFAVGAALRTGASFWWDRLATLAPRLTHDDWTALARSCGCPALGSGGDDATGHFQGIRRHLLGTLAGRIPPAFEQRLDELEDRHSARSPQRSLSADELAPFCATGVIDVGVHTMHHVVLARVSDDDVIRETIECHRALADFGLNPSPILAVPFGLFDSRTSSLARSAKMVASLTLSGHTARSASDGLIPRISMDRRVRMNRVLLRSTSVGDALHRLRGHDAQRPPPADGS